MYCCKITSVFLSFAAKCWRCFTNALMTLRRYEFSRQHRRQFSEDVYAFVLWRYVAVQIWRVKELFVPGIVASTIKILITPPTSFSQSRHSIDVTWRHTLSPRCTQRQKSVTGIHWNARCRLNKGWWRDKFVIRSVSDVLRTQSRLVKCVGGSACGLTPHKFY